MCYGPVARNLMLISIKGLVLYVTYHLSCWLNLPFKLARGISLFFFHFPNGFDDLCASEQNVMSNGSFYELFILFYLYSWNFELKTIETVGMVLYNSAADFIALEIVNSRLRFLVGKGSNAVELVSERNITDGKWHNVSIAYSPFLVEVAFVWHNNIHIDHLHLIFSISLYILFHL